MGARFWRLRPGQASTKHRHRETTELYVVLEGEGRIRVDDDSLSLPRLSALLVTPESVRQVFNDTETDALWLIFGAPSEAANTLEMSRGDDRVPLSRRAEGAAAGALGMTDRLHFTGNEEADALIAADPFALLVGFALDQQVQVQKAFMGPFVLRERLGAC